MLLPDDTMLCRRCGGYMPRENFGVELDDDVAMVFSVCDFCDMAWETLMVRCDGTWHLSRCVEYTTTKHRERVRAECQDLVFETAVSPRG